MRASKTHFEQIPVGTVKRIAKDLPSAIEINDMTAETQNEVKPQPERWREMAQKVRVEYDPQTMTKLVEELIAAFDEESLRKYGKTPRRRSAT